MRLWTACGLGTRLLQTRHSPAQPGTSWHRWARHGIRSTGTSRAISHTTGATSPAEDSPPQLITALTQRAQPWPGGVRSGSWAAPVGRKSLGEFSSSWSAQGPTDFVCTAPSRSPRQLLGAVVSAPDLSSHGPVPCARWMPLASWERLGAGKETEPPRAQAGRGGTPSCTPQPPGFAHHLGWNKTHPLGDGEPWLGDTESSRSASAPSSQPQAGFGRGYAGRRAPMGAAPSRGDLGWGRGSEPLPCSQLSCPTASARPQDGTAKPPSATLFPLQGASPPKKKTVLYFVLGSPRSRHTDPGASARPRAGRRQSSPGACL